MTIAFYLIKCSLIIYNDQGSRQINFLFASVYCGLKEMQLSLTLFLFSFGILHVELLQIFIESIFLYSLILYEGNQTQSC